jgi:hypothetical protein
VPDVGALRNRVAKKEKCGLFSQIFDEMDVNALKVVIIKRVKEEGEKL